MEADVKPNNYYLHHDLHQNIKTNDNFQFVDLCSEPHVPVEFIFARRFKSLTDANNHNCTVQLCTVYQPYFIIYFRISKFEFFRIQLQARRVDTVTYFSDQMTEYINILNSYDLFGWNICSSCLFWPTFWKWNLYELIECRIEYEYLEDFRWKCCEILTRSLALCVCYLDMDVYLHNFLV